jgi:hypothetical protein
MDELVDAAWEWTFVVVGAVVALEVVSLVELTTGL